MAVNTCDTREPARQRRQPAGLQAASQEMPQIWLNRSTERNHERKTCYKVEMRKAMFAFSRVLRRVEAAQTERSVAASELLPAKSYC